MNNLDDRRVSVRMPFIAKGFCHIHEMNKKCHGTLRDISIIGLFLELNDCPKVGTLCSVEIVFEGKHSRLKIENVAGIITRSEKDGVAISFDERLEWFILIPLYFHKMRAQSKLS